MALSEREQQMLDEMEQALYAEDPRFASQMQGRGRAARSRRALGVLGAIAGLALVVLGINTTFWVGVAGFVLVVASVAALLAPAPSTGSEATLGVVTTDGAVRPSAASTPAAGRGRFGRRAKRSGASRSRPQHSATFMQRMEHRWEERRRGGQGW